MLDAWTLHGILLSLIHTYRKEFCWAGVEQLQPSHRKHCASASMKSDMYDEVWCAKTAIK